MILTRYNLSLSQSPGFCPSGALKRRCESLSVRCLASDGGEEKTKMVTCKNCKTRFDLFRNHSRACRFHPAHFGGETKRKFESVYEGGTLNTPNSGAVFQYWHCCGSEDPFDLGCTQAPHATYDDQ